MNRDEKINKIMSKMEDFINNFDELATMNCSYTEILIINYYIKYLESLVNCYDSIISKCGNSNER